MPAKLKVTWSHHFGVVAVEANGTEHPVPGLHAHYLVAGFNYGGDRGWWCELALYETDTTWTIRYTDVHEHEGGADLTITDFVSDDRGATWQRVPAPPPIDGEPVDKYETNTLYWLERMRPLIRDNYPAMAAFARVLAQAGRSQDDVLHECYGVRFPIETFVMAELIAEGKEPGGHYTNRPWNLLIPIDRGGPPAHPAPLMDGDERRMFVLDPSLIPLMLLHGDYCEYGGTYLCYRIEELEAGRSTILGWQQDLKDGSVASRYGDSLAAVLLASAADTVRRLEHEFASPYKRGAGSLDQHELDGAREDLACIEELIRRVAERRRPKLVP